LLTLGAFEGDQISNKTAGFGIGLYISNKIAERLSELKREEGGGL
jgi:hypothetical protein